MHIRFDFLNGNEFCWYFRRKFKKVASVYLNIILISLECMKFLERFSIGKQGVHNVSKLNITQSAI